MTHHIIRFAFIYHREQLQCNSSSVELFCLGLESVVLCCACCLWLLWCWHVKKKKKDFYLGVTALVK